MSKEADVPAGIRAPVVAGAAKGRKTWSIGREAVCIVTLLLLLLLPRAPAKHHESFFNDQVLAKRVCVLAMSVNGHNDVRMQAGRQEHKACLQSIQQSKTALRDV